MINLEIKEQIPQLTKDADFPIDPLNELDPITLGLRSFMRHHNHKVCITQGDEKVEIAFDPELICNVELFPGYFFDSLNRVNTDITFAYWPVILHVRKTDNIFSCQFSFSDASDSLTEDAYKMLLVGFAEKIANMAKEKGYLTNEQVSQFLTGKWW